MTTILKQILSGSSDGQGIKVAAIATPGTTLHTSHATSEDEIYLYAVNTSASDVKLTVEWGGQTAPDDLIEYTVKAEDGLYLVVPGLILSNSKSVTAFAATADVVVCHGFVNRITP